MNLIDSSGWLHCLLNGPLVERYLPFLSRPREVLTPTIVMYEVYKKIRREGNEELAHVAAGAMGETNIVELTPELAYLAADFSTTHKLSLADAVIYATAQTREAKLVTSDADLKDLPGVTFFPLEE